MFFCSWLAKLTLMLRDGLCSVSRRLDVLIVKIVKTQTSIDVKCCHVQKHVVPLKLEVRSELKAHPSTTQPLNPHHQSGVSQSGVARYSDHKKVSPCILRRPGRRRTFVDVSERRIHETGRFIECLHHTLCTKSATVMAGSSI